MTLLREIEKILEDFSKRGMKIAVAESCTGGFISHMFTNISGASKVFDRGIVSYSNEAKIELLGVKRSSIEQYGAVSKQVAREMAKGIQKQCDADVGIGVTGIAGPTGGTPKKPVGLVYIGFSSRKETLVHKYLFKASRINFKTKVLSVILENIESHAF